MSRIRTKMTLSDAIDLVAPYYPHDRTLRHNHIALITNLAQAAGMSKRGRRKGLVDARAVIFNVIESLSCVYDTYWEDLEDDS